jgi:6-phosphogluconolactonase
MTTRTTPYGTIQTGDLEQTFQSMVRLIEDTVNNKAGGLVTVGLSGGSTPKAFYTWVVNNQALSPKALVHCLWSTSDERHVPLNSPDSNFGNADRDMLTPLNTPATGKMPWPVELDPEACCQAYNQAWNQIIGADQGFDLCFLGMGDDAHTASLFPGCPLIGSGITDNFACTEWPGRGWRLTITEAGLAKCGQIIMVTNGAGKAEALQQVIHGDYNPRQYPSQIHRAHADRTLWLVDDAAAALL